MFRSTDTTKQTINTEMLEGPIVMIIAVHIISIAATVGKKGTAHSCSNVDGKTFGPSQRGNRFHQEPKHRNLSLYQLIWKSDPLPLIPPSISPLIEHPSPLSSVVSGL